MEYLLGSLLTLIIMSYFGRRSAAVLQQKPAKLRISQSYNDSLILKNLISRYLAKEKKITQSTKHHSKNDLRVLMIDGEAFWIIDQTLFVAKIIDGVVDNENAKRVDTMSMNDVQLDKTQFIVQKLTEGKEDDSGYPRKS